MFKCQFSLCLLLSAAVLQIALCAPSRSIRSLEPTVIVRNAKGVTSQMTSQAVNVLTRALTEENALDPCEILGIYFEEQYPDYVWHVVDYNGYYVHSLKSIGLAVNDDKYYLLFATNQ